MLSLLQVKREERELLWNMLQKYLEELTEYYPLDRDENGCYPYRYFDAYFLEPERIAYFILCDGLPAGFAMINRYSCLGHHPDHAMAEFTVLPEFRRRHLASEASRMILEKHPGKWEIKFSEKNTAAKKLWETLAAEYGPAVYHMEDETVLEFATGRN